MMGVEIGAAICPKHNWSATVDEQECPRCRISELEKLVERYCGLTTKYGDQAAALQAQLDDIKALPHYICEFPDIGKIGGAYRRRDVLRIIAGEDDE
jgi:hypothetical protein